ncbi:diguanylate cyclase [Sulfurimonas sp. HSL-1716]|uniref:GGDEF domain-containing protein n=1 Tax=Hydrocurvibacter sulfurireducens TaxID=3131937 RepID=UPI0031F7C3AB
MNAIYLIGEWLKERADEVVDTWLDNTVIKEIFLNYHIDIKKFSAKFSHAILTHNIEVLQDKKKMDDCPIMNKFVDLMIEKNIRSEDIFTICSGLRTTIFNKLWKEYPEFSKDISSIQKIFFVFDRNLSGVLANFDQKNIAKHSQKNLKHYLERLQTVFDVQDNIVFKIHDGELHLANKAFFLTLGIKSLKAFKEKYPYPLAFIKHVNTFESLFKTQDYIKWIKKLIKENNGECKVEIFDHITNKKSIMHMKIADVGENVNDFIFTFTNITEQQREIKKLKDLVYKDSSTELANFKRFEEMIEEKLKKLPENGFKILMMHLRGFKITNEMYGKEKGEHILKNIADVLNKHFPGRSARIDIDRFAVMSDDMTLSVAENTVKEIDDILAKDKYANNINTNSAIVLFHDQDTKESILERGDILLNHVKNNNDKIVFDETIMQEKENERLRLQQMFLELMHTYHDENKKIPITSYYLDIPIRSDADILNINNSLMSVTLRKISLFSLYRNDNVYIEMPEKPNFKATVIEVNAVHNKVMLGDFKAVDTSPLDRRSIHVKLQRQIDISVKSPKNSINAELDSLSINSFVIIIDHLYDIDIGTSLDMKVTITDHEMELNGNVHKLIAVADKFKIIVHISPMADVQEEIVQFISNRQIEIIKELQKNVL